MKLQQSLQSEEVIYVAQFYHRGKHANVWLCDSIRFTTIHPWIAHHILFGSFLLHFLFWSGIWPPWSKVWLWQVKPFSLTNFFSPQDSSQSCQGHIYLLPLANNNPRRLHCFLDLRTCSYCLACYALSPHFNRLHIKVTVILICTKTRYLKKMFHFA